MDEMDVKYSVKVSVGNDDIYFEFDTFEEAISFAKITHKSALPAENYRHEICYPEITITMEPIKLTRGNEDKED